MPDRRSLAILVSVLFVACSPSTGAVLFGTDAGMTDILHLSDGATPDASTDGAITDGSSMDATATDGATATDQGPATGCSDGGVVCDSGCVYPNTDPNNCGLCGHACAAGQICHVGFCVANPCPGNAVPCDPPDGGLQQCIDVSSDPNNCGGCGVTCAAGMQCSGGACFINCTSPLIRCGSVCSDISTDPLNCGACSNACGAGQTCVSNVCVCAAPFTTCGTVCANTTNDSAHCGSCSNACGAGTYCRSSACIACAAPQTLCPMGVCTDTTSDPNNCGGCGRVCGGAASCVSGSCSCSAPGLVTCGTTCVDTHSDPSNCGGCGTVCPGGMSCASGTCGITTHYSLASTPPGVTFIDACAAAGSMTYLASRYEASQLVPLPFAFRYWTTSIAMGSMVNITTSGWIGMDGVELITPSGSIPTGGSPFAIIAPHWGFGENTSPGQCVATVGTAPFRKWVAEWQSDYYYPTASGVSLTYEVILSETANTIDFVYSTMTGARSETAGIGDYTGAMGLGACPGGATTCAPTSGMTVRFLPIP